MLLPRQTQHDSKTIAQSDVEQPDWRRLVNSDGVYAIGRHTGEITFDFAEVGELFAVRIRTKRSVGHAPNVELLVSDKDEFPSGARPEIGAGPRGQDNCVSYGHLRRGPRASAASHGRGSICLLFR